MANRRVLVKRRKAVRNIRKITRTMQLIATARFQATQSRATATKPYSDKLGELVADLSRAAGDAQHPLMQKPDADRSALVVVSSNRGLCGGYNANVLRQATAPDIEDQPEGHDVDVHMIGKKGTSYFRFLGRDIKRQITDLAEDPRFDQIEPDRQRSDSTIRGRRDQLGPRGVHVVRERRASIGPKVAAAAAPSTPR